MLEGRRHEASMGAESVSTSEVSLTAAGVTLTATLGWPEHCQGVVLFAHGSGSGRFSPRNRQVAASLQEAGLATLLLDLLTPGEERSDTLSHRWRFAIPMLADRLTGAVDWLGQAGRAAGVAPSSLPLGLFGASTGAAAAVISAAARPAAIGAIVCRGGRPDLAPAALPRVRCPTLFIVGGADSEVLALNQQAASAMTAPHRLSVIPGASHLFPEAGALEAVCVLARDWFSEHLRRPADRPASPMS
jgi:pimeloyl-ACP methyl ester carboxylesterase